MREELGVHGNEIRDIRFLGITRELLRGGMTELFHAVDISLTHTEVLERMPKDKEGIVKTVFLGPMASCKPGASDGRLSADQFWQVADRIQTAGGSVISLPLLTNLVLWYRTFYPPIMGTDKHLAATAMVAK